MRGKSACPAHLAASACGVAGKRLGGIRDLQAPNTACRETDDRRARSALSPRAQAWRLRVANNPDAELASQIGRPGLRAPLLNVDRARGRAGYAVIRRNFTGRARRAAGGPSARGHK